MTVYLILLSGLLINFQQDLAVVNLDPVEMVECIHHRRLELDRMKRNTNQTTVTIDLNRIMRLEQLLNFYEELAESQIPRSMWSRIIETNVPNGFDDHPDKNARIIECSKSFLNYETYLREQGIIVRRF